MTPSPSPEVREPSSSFTSALSAADFAACLALGLEPIGLVQGLCAMQSTSVGRGVFSLSTPMVPSGGYLANYPCPHGFVTGEHRPFGQNYEQSWLGHAWRDGYGTARTRLVDAARALGADGVVGVVESETALADSGVLEFSLRGTAVRVTPGGLGSAEPFTTYLSGQRLAKAFEAGFAPVSIVGSFVSVRVWASCVTEFLLGGSPLQTWSAPSGPVEIDQLADAHARSRELVRDDARAQLRGGHLRAARLEIAERELGPGDIEIQARLRGNSLRPVGDAVALATPRPTLRLS